MNEYNRNLRIGLFCVSGLVLFIAMLFFLGLSDLFAQKATLRTFFSESVQGLSIGSQVKYRGVPIGTVSKIQILTSEKVIAVDMDIELKHFFSTKTSEATNYSKFLDFINNDIKSGLRCRLEFAGITGMKFIDLDYFAKDENKLPANITANLEGSTIFIPSVASSFKDIVTTITLTLEKISKFNFEEIGNELENSLSGLSSILKDPALKSSISQINEAAINLKNSTHIIAQVVTEQRLNKILENMEKNLKSIDNFFEEARLETKNMKLPETVGDIRTTINSINDSKEDFIQTLKKLESTLTSLKLLIDSIDKDPQQIIRGKAKPQVFTK
jgi:ABC-type transporter Mla subunit MlaD